jgi:hypothetical protein
VLHLPYSQISKYSQKLGEDKHYCSFRTSISNEEKNKFFQNFQQETERLRLVEDVLEHRQTMKELEDNLVSFPYNFSSLSLLLWTNKLEHLL